MAESIPFGSIFNLPEAPSRKSTDYIQSYRGLVYSCVMRIAQEVSTIQLHLYKKKKSRGKIEAQEVVEHESLAILDFVNDFTTKNDLFFITTVYKKLTGEAYWALMRNKKQIYNIWPLRPDWVTVHPSKEKYIDHYTYRPWGSAEEFRFEPQDIVPFKDVNPSNPYRGYGSVQATAMSIDIMDYLQSWNRNFFVNSAVPNVIFTTDKKLSEESVKRFMRTWRNEYAGVQNASKVGFLGGGLTPTVIQQSIRDMDFKNLKDSVRDDILASFGVPKSILGLSEDVNRASMQVSKQIFAENTVKPELLELVAYLNKFFLPQYEPSGDFFYDFDDPTPEDVDLKLSYYANALGAGGGKQWMTINEVRESENLEPLDGFDEIQQFNPNPFGTDEPEEGRGLKFFNKKKVIEKKKVKRMARKVKHHVFPPIKAIGAYQEDNILKEIRPDLVKLVSKLIENKNAGKNGIDEMKEKYWKGMIEQTDEKEVQMRKIMWDFFKRQEKTVVDSLYTSKGLVTKDFSWDIDAQNRELELVMSPFIKQIVAERGHEVLSRLGKNDLNMALKRVVDFLKSKQIKLAGDINETTLQRLRDTLADGVELGEGIPDLKKRIELIFENATTFRTETIARTEVLDSFNFAAEEAYKQSGVVIGKEWLTAFDERTCEWCAQMNGKVIDVNETFFKKGDSYRGSGGGLLDLSYKSVGHPPLHANCRCTLLPILSEAGEVAPIQKKVKEELDISLDELEKIKIAAIQLDAEIAQKKAQTDKEVVEIKEKAKEEAEVEKKTILSELKELRGKARKAINGK